MANLLKQRILDGTWGEKLPGRDRLMKELGVSGKTVGTALKQLQNEGFLVSAGPGRSRRVAKDVQGPKESLRVAILDYDPLAQTESHVLEIQYQLVAAGHRAFFTRKSTTQLKMEVGAVARMVKETEADAWLVVAGSQDILDWFTSQGIPVFAMYGRRRGLPIAGAGPDKPSAYRDAVLRLLELGHRRIVLFARKDRRLPDPGASERAFLKTLEAHGISTSSYNLPDWEETVAGFHARLQSLFQVTPPTALIFSEATFFFAAQQFLMNQGLRVPKDVSLISSDNDRHFAWFKPPVAHIRWDTRPMMRRIVQWANNLARGKTDIRQAFTKAQFVEAGTIGPAKREPSGG